MHWKTLDLEPGDATEKDVKRAYARRLKKCRPDQDPEGFRLLHEAYQTALGELEWRSQSIPFPESSPRMDPAPHGAGEAAADPCDEFPAATSRVPVPPAVAAMLEVMDRLEDSLKNEGPDVAERVRDAEAALFANPDIAVRWGDSIYQLISRHGQHPDLRLKPEAMLFELEHHSLAATLAVIDRLDHTENRLGIGNLAKLLLARKNQIKTQAGGIAASRLACVAAFWSQGNVAPLADFAYENLARGERDFHMELIDRHVAISALLSNVPISLRTFWRQRLIHNSGNEIWDDEASIAAIRWLGSPLGRRNPAFEVLRGLLPGEVADSINFAKPPPSEPNEHPGDEITKTRNPNTASATSGGGETFSWESDNQPPRPRPATHSRHVSPPNLSRVVPPGIIFIIIFMIFKILTMGFDSPGGNHQGPDNRSREFEKLKLLSAEEMKVLMERSSKEPESKEPTRGGKRMNFELMPPDSARDADPKANPFLKLLEEPSGGAK